MSSSWLQSGLFLWRWGSYPTFRPQLFDVQSLRKVHRAAMYGRKMSSQSCEKLNAPYSVAEGKVQLFSLCWVKVVRNEVEDLWCVASCEKLKAPYSVGGFTLALGSVMRRKQDLPLMRLPNRLNSFIYIVQRSRASTFFSDNFFILKVSLLERALALQKDHGW